MKATKKMVLELVGEINNYYGYEFCKIHEYNGYVHVLNSKTNESITPDHAVTLKEIVLSLKSFKKGIYAGNVGANNERVFMVLTSRGYQYFCNLDRLNVVAKDLHEGYFSIYYADGNKFRVVTKKLLKAMFEAKNMVQEFYY